MVVVTPDRELVVNLTLDSTALVAELDRVVAVLAAAADQLRPASPVPSPPMTFEEMPESERELLSGEPVDRTGLCDHCDKPQTGGAAGGGISPEHWCDDHRPDEYEIDPAWFDDTDGAAAALEDVRNGDRVRITIETTVERVDDGTWWGSAKYEAPGRVDLLYGNRHTLEVPPTDDRDATGTTIAVEVLA